MVLDLFGNAYGLIDLWKATYAMGLGTITGDYESHCLGSDQAVQVVCEHQLGIGIRLSARVAS
ncbi:MAG: hypothetical protein ACR2IK_01720 [Chloroflexota bacterium]